MPARLRLRHDAVFAKAPQGVLVRHSDGGFYVRGENTYQWLASIAPFLDGSLTREELLAGLDEDRAKMVEQLVRALSEKDVVTEVSGRSVLEDDELAEYRAQIAYIDHYADHGATRFERFRSADIRVWGDGPLARTVQDGLRLNGLRAIASMDTASPDSADLVVVCAEDGDSSRIVAALRDGETAVLPVTRWGSTVVLGPLSGAGRESDWTTAMTRMTRNDPATAAEVWRAAALPGNGRRPAALGALHTSIIGLATAYEAFRVLTAAPAPETDGAVVVFDMETGDSHQEQVLPDPRSVSLGATGVPTVKDIRLGGVATPADTDEYSATSLEDENEELKRYLQLVGEYVGVVRDFDDEDIDQSPVKISRALIGADGRASAMRGFALETLGDARRDAVQRAVLDYVAHVGPIPRAPEPDAAGTQEITASDLVLATGLGGPGSDADPAAAPVIGRALGGELVAVPAAAVYARSDLNSAGDLERSSAGEGSGPSLPDAIRQGIISAIAFEAVREAARGAACRSYPSGHVDAATVFLRESAGILRNVPELVVLPTRGTAAVVLARNPHGSAAYAVGAGVDLVSAANDALLSYLGRSLVPEGRPMSDELLLPGFDPRTIRVDSSTSTTSLPAPEASGLGLAEQLRAEGRQAVVVDTTPADVLSTGALRTVRVLLTRAGA
ncbi:TOMM precursor leader peptide-binding protein [Brachybacterium sp. DNPG3]